jgi:hypothetical protein
MEEAELSNARPSVVEQGSTKERVPPAALDPDVFSKIFTVSSGWLPLSLIL